MQLGDIASVKTGPHMGVSRTVVEIHGGMVRLHPIYARQPSNVIIQIASLSFYPPPTTLQFTTDQGYNVRLGDAVMVVHRKWLGRMGIVSVVNLGEKTLAVAGHANTVSVPVISYIGVDQHYFNRVVLSCRSRSLLTNTPYRTAMKLTTTKERRSSSSLAIIRGGEEPFERFPNIRAWSPQEMP